MFNTTMPKTCYQWSGSNGASSLAHHLHVTSYSLSVTVFTTATTCPYPEPDQSCPAPSPQSYFLRIHFNINLSYMLRCSKRYLSIRFCHQNYVCTSPLPFIIIFINCNWVITWWQWLYYMYTNMGGKKK